MIKSIYKKFQQDNFSTPLHKQVFISALVLCICNAIGVYNSMYTISYWLLDAQYSYTQIAFLTSILHLPYSMRMLFIPWLDYINITTISTWGHRKTMLCYLSFISCIALILLSYVGLGNIYYCLILCLIACVCSTATETLTTAFYVHTYNQDLSNSWIAGGQIGYQIGVYFVYTFLLALSQFYSWNVLYFYTAVVSFLMMITMLYFMDDCTFERQTKPNLNKVYWQPMKNFYQMHKDQFTPLMIFTFFYRAPEKMIATLLPLFMVSIYGKVIAAGLKTVNLLGILIGSFAWKMFKNKNPVKVLLSISRLHIGAILTLGLACLLYESTYSIYAGIFISILGFCIKLFRTMESAALFSFQCSLYDKNHFSAQYSISAFADKAFGNMLASTSGAIRDACGWNLFFIISCVSVLPAWICAKRLFMTKK